MDKKTHHISTCYNMKLGGTGSVIHYSPATKTLFNLQQKLEIYLLVTFITATFINT